MTPSDRAHLQSLRDALLVLHKALLDSERIAYEQAFGTIPSAQEFLKLLLQDPWFAWLKPLSELIVSLDERLDDRRGRFHDTAEEFVRRTRALLTVAEDGGDFSRQFDTVLQRDPDVILAQASVARLLRSP
jgi:hypothetical protein